MTTYEPCSLLRTEANLQSGDVGHTPASFSMVFLKKTLWRKTRHLHLTSFQHYTALKEKKRKEKKNRIVMERWRRMTWTHGFGVSPVCTRMDALSPVWTWGSASLVWRTRKRGAREGAFRITLFMSELHIWKHKLPFHSIFSYFFPPTSGNTNP